MSDYVALMNEASLIANELNEANHRRCDLLVWIAALKMAAKVVIAKHALIQPEHAKDLEDEVAHIDLVIQNMTIILHQLKPGETARDVVQAYEMSTDPKDVS